MRKEGLSDDSTVVDYMFKRLMNGMDSDLPPNLREEIINYILKLFGVAHCASIKSKRLNWATQSTIYPMRAYEDSSF